MSEAFQLPPANNPYLQELKYIVEERLPSDEEILVFTLKGRDRIDYATVIQDMFSGDERVHVVTWGAERGSNRFSHVKYGINVGMVYRDRKEIAGSIIAQTRQLDYQLTEEDVSGVLYSEQAEMLYQGISRLNTTGRSTGCRATQRLR